MSNLDKEVYICRVTGQDIEVTPGTFYCPALRDKKDCGTSTGICSVVAAHTQRHIPHAQSQPKLTPTSELGYTAQIMSQLHPTQEADFVLGEHPSRRDDGFVHPYRKD
jgi:hypothetical protein